MTDNAQVVMTPTIARFARRSLFWVAITLIIVVIAAIGLAISTIGKDADPMSAANPTPNGAKALVEVLRHEGVTVTVAGTLAEARDAVTDPATTTVFFYDPGFYLDEEQTGQALDLADTVVVLQPTYDALDHISPELGLAGYLGGTLDAQCSVDAAVAAEQITTEGDGYRVISDSFDGEACFGDSEGVFSLVQVENHGVQYTVLGASEALTNGTILENGNAALGLTLLGSTKNLVWYLPTASDFDSGTLTTAELSPPWVLPVTLTLFLVGIAAILWRGRRFGPLIVENLPVTVRASETMQGRARLYERANARLHTLDSLRIGTIARLAALCGLPVLATVDEVVTGVSAVAAMDAQYVRSLLVDAQPASDSDLVRLSDDLLVLEQTVASRIRPH